jgi:hypothetical protein
MGKTRDTGFLTNGIWQDASNNIGIGGSPSGSYKFEVTGTGRINSANTTLVLDTTSTSFDASLRLNNNSSATTWGIIQAGPGAISGGGMNMYTTGAYPFTFGTNGTERMRITSTGNVGIGTTNPITNLHIKGSTNSVIYAVGSSNAYRAEYQVEAAGQFTGSFIANPSASSSYGGIGTSLVGITTSSTAFVIATSEVERMRITSDGRLLINQSSGATNVKVKIRVSDQSSSNYALLIDNSVTDLLQIRNDGAMYIGLATASPYNLTTGAAANAVVASDGYLARSTSSLKYKKNVKDYDKGLNDVLQLRPVYYESINQKEDGIQYAGFIAEEVHELGLTEFVQYAEDGSPDALAYQNMVSLLVKAIQEQNQLISELSAKVSALENKS